PAAARVTPPEADARGKMRRRGDWDNSLPALALPRVIENRQLAAGLHNPAEAAKVRQRCAQAPLTQAAIFWTVRGTHDAARGSRNRVEHVIRRYFLAPRGWRTVLPARAGRQLLLAHLGGLQQGEPKLSEFASLLLFLRSKQWNPSVGRIHDHRSSTA